MNQPRFKTHRFCLFWMTAALFWISSASTAGWAQSARTDPKTQPHNDPRPHKDETGRRAAADSQTRPASNVEIAPGGTMVGEVVVGDVHYKPTPRWWMLEIKFGPYKPAVDQESGLSGKPYRDIFGCMPGRNCSSRYPGVEVLSNMELDFQFWKGHGSLGVGATIGYFRVTGHALKLTDPDQPYDPEDNPYVRSADETVLNYLPLVLQLVYRWDYAARHHNIPLVPYIKAGGVYAFWWIDGPDGDVARFTASSGKARGGTFGYQINVGLAFELNFLEPSTAKKMDTDMGINSVYLFCEFVHSQVRWATDKRMRLGMPATFLAGLSWEF
jgi:hypothetical protein